MKKTSNIYHNDFINFSTKESVYLLGFLWADGSFYTRSHRNRNNIRIEICSEDAIEILPVINKTGKWNIFQRQRKARKSQTTFHGTSAPLKLFLEENGYLNRTSDNIMFDNIPNAFKMYFLRGLIDGDGCFYQSKDSKTNQFSICSAFNQNWNSIFRYFERYGIKTYLQTEVRANGNSYSKLRVFGKANISKLDKLVYFDNYDGIGLPRKFYKCKNIVA